MVSIVHIHCLIKEAVFAMPRWEPGGTEVFFDLPGLHQVLGERTLWPDFLSDAESKKKRGAEAGKSSRGGSRVLELGGRTSMEISSYWLAYFDLLCYFSDFQLAALKARWGFME